MFDFSLEQKIKMLKDAGFEIHKTAVPVTVIRTTPSYDEVSSTMGIHGVYLNGERIKREWTSRDNSFSQINEIFANLIYYILTRGLEQIKNTPNLAADVLRLPG